MSGGPDEPDVILDGDFEDFDAVEWLDGAAEDELASHRSAFQALPAFPAHTARRRVVSSLLLVGAVLAGTGYGANAVYHRDRAADRKADLAAGTAADELILAAPASRGISLPGLGGPGSAAARTERPSTEIAVPVVNRGPDPITLLPGATLLGPGLTSSNLGAAASLLAPGQSTVLRGSVTVDCARPTPDTGRAAVTSLMISARTSGGGLGVSTVAFAGAAGSVRDRVCAARAGG